MPRKNTANALNVVRFYWKCILKYPRVLTGALFVIPVTILCSQYLPPLILANALRRLTTHDYISGQPWQSFGREIILYAGIQLLGSLVLWRVVDRFVWHLEGNILKDIAERVFKHLTDQSANFHADRFSGSLVSQTNKILTSYVRMADTTFFSTLPLVSGILIASVILFGKSKLFVICLLIFSVLYVLSSIFITRSARERSAEHGQAESKQTGYLADALSNMMAIKSFSGEKFEEAGFARNTLHTKKQLMKLMGAVQKQMTYFSSASSLIYAMSFAVAIVSVVSYNADVVTVFLILNYTATIVGQLFSFSNQSLRNYNRAIGDASDMVEILAMDAEVADPAKPEKVHMARGEIRFNDVTFTHREAESSIFSGLNLKIKPGEKVGLIGHSGSGKSSLTRVLLRFSDVDSGSVTIDGQNIANVRQSELRAVISYVPQEPLLFHRTIAENISYGRPKAELREIMAVARQANAHEFIEALPKGYDTLVGERGVKLSGGQRQRVAIARAMIKNAPILVLDEATSALDSESEGLIQDALWKLMEGRTAIVIAHRLSTIQRMDRIIVLEEGKIVEEGSHKDLLYKKGVYAKLWEHQSGGFLED